jgi:hypothetical protein
MEEVISSIAFELRVQNTHYISFTGNIAGCVFDLEEIKTISVTQSKQNKTKIEIKLKV